jgi:hypothetical protein
MLELHESSNSNRGISEKNKVLEKTTYSPPQMHLELPSNHHHSPEHHQY